VKFAFLSATVTEFCKRRSALSATYDVMTVTLGL